VPETGKTGAILDAIVVGAGISGLATAFCLKQQGLSVAVLEASSRVGGSIETVEDGGFLCELGPNTVVENHPSVGALIAACGLAGAKLTASPQAKRRYLYKGGPLIPLPGGPPGLLKTPLFSWRAKLRLLREPWVGRPPEGTEETIAEFVRRRLGPELLDYAVGPFVSGVYAGDPERLSVRWAVPKIAALEREHGSLIRGALAKRKGPSPGGAMISFNGGLSTLPRHLAEAIGDVRTGVAVRKVRPMQDGFAIESSQGEIKAKRVVLAVPADVAASLLDEATNGKSRLFAEIPYAPVAVVCFGFRRVDVAHPLDGFGFLAPRCEKLRPLGCLFPSSVFPARAPEGHVLLTAFAGGRTDPEIVSWDEERIAREILQALRPALGITGSPVVTRVRRWARAIPQYELGHGRFVARAKEIEKALPGLSIGGNFLFGISVPDCIRNAVGARAV
jgi:oxygen-dependent protoporphyrinogen oxidase